MSIPSNSEILALLDRLDVKVADDLESQMDAKVARGHWWFHLAERATSRAS